MKIFDFGLARETDSLGKVRHMTGNAGTPRYMSPEIARNEDYGFASDVYSFSILLWEIVTLGKPFDSIKSLPQFNEEVVRRHLRPPLKKVNSPGLRTLLQQCWDKDQESTTYVYTSPKGSSRILGKVGTKASGIPPLLIIT